MDCHLRENKYDAYIQPFVYTLGFKIKVHFI